MKIKIIISIIISIILTLNSAFAFGKIVLDPSNLAKNIITSGAAMATKATSLITSVATTKLQIKELIGDKLAFKLAQNSANDIKEEMVNWIQTGLNGNPLFVENPEKLFENLVEDQLLLLTKDLQGSETLLAQNSFVSKILTEGLTNDSKFVESITSNIGTSICSKLANDINIAKSNNSEDLEYVENRYKNICQNTNANAKYNAEKNCAADASCGGIDAILAITQNFSRNTEIGRFETAINEYQNRLNEEKKKIDDELNRGDGFLNQKECIKHEVVEGKKICVESKTVNPGIAASEAAKVLVSSPLDEIFRIDELGESVSSITGAFLGNIISGGISKAFSGLGEDDEGQTVGSSDGVSSSVIDGVPQYAVINNDTVPEETNDMSIEDYKNYMSPILSIVNQSLKENSKVKSIIEKERGLYSAVFNSYSEVAICYKNKYDEQTIKNFQYPDIIPISVRNRTEDVYIKIQALNTVLNKSKDFEKKVNEYIKLMAESKSLNVLNYYKNKLDAELDNQSLPSLGEWEMRDVENTYGGDGDETKGLYYLLNKEARETLSNIVTTGNGDSAQSQDISPLAVCKAIQPNPVAESSY